MLREGGVCSEEEEGIKAVRLSEEEEGVCCHLEGFHSLDTEGEDCCIRGRCQDGRSTRTARPRQWLLGLQVVGRFAGREVDKGT